MKERLLPLGLLIMCMNELVDCNIPVRWVPDGIWVDDAEAIRGRHIYQLPTNDLFLDDKYIAQGNSGAVLKVTYLGEQRALKIMKKFRSNSYMIGEQRKGIQNEMNILRKVRHISTISLLEVFESHRCVYFLMEYCPNGTLRTQLEGSGASSLSEEEASMYIRQTVNALLFMHVQGVSHGDISLDNIMLDVEGSAKLGDFGSVTENADNEKFIQDLFDLGVVMYRLLGGQGSNTDMGEGKFVFPPTLSDNAKSLLEVLLIHKDSSIDDIAVHPWLAE